MREIRRGVAVKLQEASFLVRKVGTEIRDPSQLLDPQRRLDLWKKGKQRLASLGHRHEFSLSAIETLVQDSLISATTHEGIRLYLSTAETVHGMVFPDETRIVFRPPFEDEPIQAAGKLVAEISGTTNVSGTSNAADYPSEGYRTTQGEIVSFKTRDPKDFEQHGGFFVNNTLGEIEVLDYNSFDVHRLRTLTPGEYAIEANWYMDSGNYQRVVERPNLQRKEIFNGLGVLILQNGKKKYFSVNSLKEYAQMKKVLLGDSREDAEHFAVTLRFFGAMCEEIARREGAVGWAMGGLEFTDGGTSLHSLGKLKKGSFAVYV